MASRLMRQQLARAARALNTAAAQTRLPALVLTTDERRADAVQAAATLPKGAAIVLRHTNARARWVLGDRLARLARERELFLLIAGDAALAARVKAHGLHLSEARAKEAAHWKALRPDWLVTAAAHSERALTRASLARADAALLAPAFPTLSHRDRGALGLARFRLMAARAPLPVYALGGVNAISVRRLKGAVLAGVVAIEGLEPDYSV